MLLLCQSCILCFYAWIQYEDTSSIPILSQSDQWPISFDILCLMDGHINVRSLIYGALNTIWHQNEILDICILIHG